MPTASAPLAIAALACAALAACRSVKEPGILVASDPPGARVLIDGRDTGFVTPCHLAVEEDDLWVEVRLEGYATTALHLDEGSRLTVITWDKGRVWPLGWPFPLFLTADGLFVPFRVDKSPLPSRIHVDLRLSAEAS